MIKKKFLFLLFPVLIILGFAEQPSGYAIAGLSEGFMKPISNFVQILAIILVGLISVHFKKNALINMPASFLLIILIGAFTEIMKSGTDTSTLILLCVLLYTLTVGLSYSGTSYLYTVIFSYIGFEFGTEYISTMGQNISYIHYLFGVSISTILIMAASISLALIVDWDMRKTPSEKKKKTEDMGEI